MDSDTSNCPEDSNSTDCLLRTLIQLVSDQQRADDAKTDWDPVTFVFTAVIGIIAIIFALIPVVQAFLAAGRANRRTSVRAIGKWSKKRKRRWNSSEWTVEFVTRVPVLRVDYLLPIMKQMEANDGEATGSSQVITDSNRATETRRRHPNQMQRTAATWPNFLDMVGLQEVGMMDDLLQPVDVGFLPDDLVAASAYAEIRVIVSAAAITTDAHTLLMDEKAGYPVIIGNGFQFEFRQHP
ncbi:hypothetical protein K456DRAFT_1123455 [Colletotrichum gloeosporioides 23]|nr:hypothetical protein K456DRAFT_1123455 [Colletotrichum gloeosporioides 23]